MKSEFGRGYATCLIQFYFHGPWLARDEATYAKMRAEYPNLFNPARAAEMWANGSSDHLYDLLRPRRGLSAADWRAAKAMAARAIEVGHGWRTERDSSPDECRELLAEAKRLLDLTGATTFDEAFAWDEAHGLKPSPGYSASCSEGDLFRRERGA